MRVAVMQPYLLPYMGYFQLLANVDTFVVYDNIEYTKRGWINRNRILANGEPSTFTLPLAKAPDSALVGERRIAEGFSARMLVVTFRGSSGGAPPWRDHETWLIEMLSVIEHRLFPYLLHTIRQVSTALSITTPIVVSSELDVDPSLRGQARVIATCAAVGGDHYVNPIGGLDLYDAKAFDDAGLALSILRARLSPYHQGNWPFVPGLSIVDAMMWLEVGEVEYRLRHDMDLITPEVR